MKRRSQASKNDSRSKSKQINVGDERTQAASSDNSQLIQSSVSTSPSASSTLPDSALYACTMKQLLDMHEKHCAAELAEEKGKLRKAETELAAEKKKLREAETQLSRVTADNAELAQANRAHHNELSKAENEHREALLRADIAHRKALSKLDTERREALSKANDGHARAVLATEEVRVECVELLKTNAELQAELAVARAVEVHLRNEYAGVLLENAELRKADAKAQAELAAARAVEVHLRSEHAGALTENAKLHAQNATLRLKRLVNGDADGDAEIKVEID